MSEMIESETKMLTTEMSEIIKSETKMLTTEMSEMIKSETKIHTTEMSEIIKSETEMHTTEMYGTIKSVTKMQKKRKVRNTVQNAKCPKPGANPTIVIYNASIVNFYNATDSLARFKNKNILFCFEKCSRWRCSCKFKNWLQGPML
jgi:hypothetical protein